MRQPTTRNKIDSKLKEIPVIRAAYSRQSSQTKIAWNMKYISRELMMTAIITERTLVILN